MALARFASLLAAVSLTVLLGGPAVAQTDALQEANQLFKQGQLDRAMERVNGYLATRPKDARGRFLKGLIFTEQNKPNDAIKVFTELTQDFPELPEPYNNLAVLYAGQGQYDKARTALEMAIRTHPSYATAHENLGDIYAKMASQAYDKALQLDRSNQAAQTKLNMIRDIFSGSGGTKPTTAKADVKPAPSVAAPAAKPTPPVAAATPPAAPAAPAAPPPAPAVTAKIPEPSTPKAAPAPEPARPPEAVAAKPAAPAGNEAEVLKAVQNWARAWSANDVPGYLAHYAADFKTPKGEKRADWEAERKARIAKPKKIQVAIESPEVSFNDKNRATVTFRQNYRSDNMKASSMKTLVMVKSGDKWLIQQERVGS